MIMVVANHVAGMGFEETWRASSSIRFLLLFRMPLFFFISGFLAYRASQVWDFRSLGSLLGKKLRVQIIPTVVFFLLGTVMMFSHNMGEHIEIAFHSPTKGGYWFTIVLLYMFVVYYLFCYLVSKLKVPQWIPLLVLFLISLCAYETCYLPREFNWAMGHKDVGPQFMFDSSFNELFLYFPFFIYGNVMHRYWDGAQRMMDSKWFYPLLIVVAIAGALDNLQWHLLRGPWGVIPLTLAKFALLTIVMMYFRHYSDYFRSTTVMGASLQYIGRRTLDIYLIHYYFMPYLPTVGSFFNTYRHNFAIDVTLAVIIALIVVGFAIITSNILRVSPVLKKWLFGR